MKNEIGKQIKAIRLQRHLTQVQLAMLAKLSVVTVSEVECGKKAPTLNTLKKLANILKADVCFLAKDAA